MQNNSIQAPPNVEEMFENDVLIFVGRMKGEKWQQILKYWISQSFHFRRSKTQTH